MSADELLTEFTELECLDIAAALTHAATLEGMDTRNRSVRLNTRLG